MAELDRVTEQILDQISGEFKLRADYFQIGCERDIQTGIPSEGRGKCEMSGTRTM